MIFSHSWNEKRLRKQIMRQAQKRRHQSKLKHLLIFALVLFGLYLFYSNSITKNDKTQSLPLHNSGVLQK